MVCAISLSVIAALPASFITFLCCVPVLLGVSGATAKWWKLMRRLRWFWLSLAIVYIGFTPGDAIWPQLPWSPGWEGLRLAVLRILILADIFTLVFIMQLLITRERLIAGIHALCWPLKFRSGLRDKLVMRLMLSFRYIEQMPEQYQKVREGLDPELSRLGKISRGFAQMYSQALLNKCDDEPLQFNRLATPDWYQWLIPVVVIVGFYAMSYINI